MVRILTAKRLHVIEPCEHPDRKLVEKTSFPHYADEAHYVQLYEENLEERLRLHTGREDVPYCTRKNINLLISDYMLYLRKGIPVYQFVLEGYEYFDDFEDEIDPQKPEYEEFDVAPEGWISVDEVVREKDVDKSTVTRAIYEQELTCGMATGERRRYVLRDAAYEAWSPSRKKSFLRDRRLMIAREVLQVSIPFSLGELYDRILEIERHRHGTRHLPASREDLEEFFAEALEGCPPSVAAWIIMMPAYARRFRLDSHKKRRRGLSPANTRHSLDFLRESDLKSLARGRSAPFIPYSYT